VTPDGCPKAYIQPIDRVKTVEFGLPWSSLKAFADALSFLAGKPSEQRGAVKARWSCFTPASAWLSKPDTPAVGRSIGLT
jgi:hypothetical protein